MSQRNLAWLIAVPALVVFVAVLAATAPPPEPQYKQVRTIVDVLADVEKNFYRELTQKEKQQLVEDMINGGLQKLDPYSEYFNEERLKQFAADNKGVFAGIGAYLGVDPKTGVLKVDSPMPDSPALEAGLQADDLILKIDGKETDNMRYDEARTHIKGEPGTTVKLTILRPSAGTTFDVDIKRAIIQIHPVKGFARRPDDPTKWSYLADEANKIAYIRLSEFSETAGQEVKAALKEAEAAGAKAVILDMRGNPGGLLRLSIEISDLFLGGGYIVRTRDRHETGRDEQAGNDGTAWESADKMPMVVLVNRASASAAEIVAAALQDNGRAAIVGERSYGKGSVQKSFTAPDEKSALKLTTERWLTPNGKNIHRWPESKETDEWGVRPDAGFEVKMTPEQIIQTILHQREAERIKPKANGGTKPPDKPVVDAPAPKKKVDPDQPEPIKLDPNFKDPVMEKALEHLRKKVAG